MPKKRGNGEGSFRTKGKKMEYRWCYLNELTSELERGSVTGKTKAECRRLAKEYEKKAAEKAALPEEAPYLDEPQLSADCTVAELVTNWLEVVICCSVASDTYKTYKYTCQTIVKDPLGKCIVKKTTRADIQLFFSRNANSSKSYIKKWHSFLYDAFDYATDLDICAKNPVKRIKLPEGTTQKREVFRDDELKIIERFAFIDSTFGCAMLLLLYGGLRSGEIPPLRGCDIDGKDVLHVEWSLTAAGELVSNNRTKRHTGDIPLPHYIADYIRSRCAPNDYIVVNAKGTRLHLRTFHEYYNKFFDRMDAWCDDHSIPRVRHLEVHSTRHTYASSLHEKDVNTLTQMELMRQNTTSSTKGYTHESIEQRRRAVDQTFSTDTTVELKLLGKIGENSK